MIKKSSKSNYKNDASTRLTRQLSLTTSMFLLSNETLKGLFWTVHSVKYNRTEQKLKIGIDTIDSKRGTTLSQMRKLAKPLAQKLHDEGLVFKLPMIEFFIQTEHEAIQRIYNLLDKVNDNDVQI
jgi:ribosome-binding factor A